MAEEGLLCARVSLSTSLSLGSCGCSVTPSPPWEGWAPGGAYWPAGTIYSFALKAVSPLAFHWHACQENKFNHRK